MARRLKNLCFLFFPYTLPVCWSFSSFPSRFEHFCPTARKTHVVPLTQRSVPGTPCLSQFTVLPDHLPLMVPSWVTFSALRCAVLFIFWFVFLCSFPPVGHLFTSTTCRLVEIVSFLPHPFILTVPFFSFLSMSSRVPKQPT